MIYTQTQINVQGEPQAAFEVYADETKEQTIAFCFDEANARLIAAAPDLLDALKGTDGTPNVPMVLAQALQGRNDVVISMLRELCSINANAITKAQQADEPERTG